MIFSLSCSKFLLDCSNSCMLQAFLAASLKASQSSHCRRGLQFTAAEESDEPGKNRDPSSEPHLQAEIDGGAT